MLIHTLMACRIDPRSGMQWGFGPWMFYVPGKRILQHLLPIVLLIPTILLTIAAILTEMSGSALRSFWEALPRTRTPVDFESGTKKKSRSSNYVTAETRRKKPSLSAKTSAIPLVETSSSSNGDVSSSTSGSTTTGPVDTEACAVEESPSCWNIAGRISYAREVCGGVVKSYNYWRKSGIPFFCMLYCMYVYICMYVCLFVLAVVLICVSMQYLIV